MKKELFAETNIIFDDKTYKAIKIGLGNIPLIVVKTKKGYLASTYIDKGAAEKMGDIACFVTNVRDFDDLKRAKIKHATTWAEDIGIRPGMTIKKALELLDQD